MKPRERFMKRAVNEEAHEFQAGYTVCWEWKEIFTVNSWESGELSTFLVIMGEGLTEMVMVKFG
jgi:hypothetical protein